MNWDTALEQRLTTLRPHVAFSYGPHVRPAVFSPTGNIIYEKNPGKRPKMQIIKIHGSTNWLYCENCRRVFWFPPHDSEKIADQLLSKHEWAEIDKHFKTRAQHWVCTRCQQVTLGTRIATFSYRKALDFPMFQNSWSHAEDILRTARVWAFIGYSLPAADFEFKYLLKRIQLSRKIKPELILVTGGEGANRTYKNYQKFLGRRLRKGQNVYLRGLSYNATRHLTR